jgi:hypothetical protein
LKQKKELEKRGYNKRLVLTMPARRSFSIRARHKNWVVVFTSFCQSGRWHGRTF